MRQIPATGSVPPLVRGHIDAIKQNIETITGVRGKPIPQLATGASSDDITAKVNSILSLLQNTGQSAAKSILPPDPTDAYFQPKVWVSGPDLVLGIGQHTSDSFTSETSMPLHIACGDGQEYELSMVGTFTPAAPTAGTFLLINNTTLAGNFRRNTLFLNSATSVSGLNTTAADTGFLLGYGSSLYQAKFTLWTSTLYKAINGSSKGQETTNGIRGNEKIMIESTDTTTVWDILGTITLPNAWTGSVVVKRIA